MVDQKVPQTARAVDKAVMDNAMRGNTSSGNANQGDENPASSCNESICSLRTGDSTEEHHQFGVLPPSISPAQDDQVACHSSLGEQQSSSVSWPAATLMGLAQQRPDPHGTDTHDLIEGPKCAQQNHDLVEHPHSVPVPHSAGATLAQGPFPHSNNDSPASSGEKATDVQCIRHLHLFWAFWGIVSYNGSWKALCYRNFTLWLQCVPLRCT